VRHDVFLCALNWYQVVDPKGIFADMGDHAGELETSVMMHIAPELVLPLSEAGDGRERKFKLAGLRERWVWAQRRWTSATRDTGIGNPAASTPDKGRRYFEAVTRKIAGFLIELAAADVETLYEE
jgi:creatinine amidohydrolase